MDALSSTITVFTVTEPVEVPLGVCDLNNIPTQEGMFKVQTTDKPIKFSSIIPIKKTSQKLVRNKH
jgi:hypothetical protein